MAPRGTPQWPAQHPPLYCTADPYCTCTTQPKAHPVHAVCIRMHYLPTAWLNFTMPPNWVSSSSSFSICHQNSPVPMATPATAPPCPSTMALHPAPVMPADHSLLVTRSPAAHSQQPHSRPSQLMAPMPAHYSLKPGPFSVPSPSATLPHCPSQMGSRVPSVPGMPPPRPLWPEPMGTASSARHHPRVWYCHSVFYHVQFLCSLYVLLQVQYCTVVARLYSSFILYVGLRINQKFIHQRSVGTM